MIITKFEDVLNILGKRVRARVDGRDMEGYFTKGSFIDCVGKFQNKKENEISLVCDEKFWGNCTHAGDVVKEDFEKGALCYIECVELLENSEENKDRGDKEMSKIVDGSQLKIGDKIRVLDAGWGAKGADNCIGVVIGRKGKNGLATLQSSVNIEIINSKDGNGAMCGATWCVSLEGSYEIIESGESTTEKRKDVKNIKIVFDGAETLAIINDDSIGKTVRNIEEDSNDDNIGIIVSVMRALKMDKKVESRVLNALFNEMEEPKTLKIEVLKSRVTDDLVNKVRDCVIDDIVSQLRTK